MHKQILLLIRNISLLSFVVLALVSFGAARGREKTLYTFPGGSRGDDPQTGVVSDSEGNLYGTTDYGGTYGWGTVFELKHSQTGWIEEVLYSFEGSSNGFTPSGNLLIDKAGNLYGTTFYGGTGSGCEDDSGGCGTVYELTWETGTWKKTVLYNFCSANGCSDGATPYGLTFDKAGNIYGTAGGGTGCEYGCGVVYELTPSNRGWTETVLYYFDQNNGGGFYPFSVETAVSMALHRPFTIHSTEALCSRSHLSKSSAHNPSGGRKTVAPRQCLSGENILRGLPEHAELDNAGLRWRVEMARL